MELVILIGSPGSGKTTYYNNKYANTHVRISQDDQGPKGHIIEFEKALEEEKNIVIDRQNHLRYQRERYLNPAKEKGYSTKIVWFRVDKKLCEKRIIQRGNTHPTIKLSSNVGVILRAYQNGFQQPKKSEADEIEEIFTPFYGTQQDLTHLKGRIGIFGDCHGVWDEVKQAIDQLDLDYYVFLGDINDRGPDFLKLLEFIRSNDNVYSLEGNHENKLGRWLKGNRLNISGGLQNTIDQLNDWTKEQKEDLYEWIQTLPTIIKLPHQHVCVHAGFEPTRPLDKQRYAACIMIRTYGGKGFSDKDQPFWFEHSLHEDLKQYKILFGHAIHEEIKVAENIYSLDGGAVYGKELRVAVLDTEESDQIEVHRFPCKEYYELSQNRSSIFQKKEDLVAEGYLSKSEKGDLVLYNYTDKTTFNNFWIKETIESRGTIYNRITGEVVAQAFPKFFNMGEREDTELKNLPLHEDYIAFEKADGSLGILYEHDGQYKIATRGSFYSEQAIKGTEMLNKYNLSSLPKNTTLLFEIIYPDNHIVVPYGDKEELVLLAAFNYKTGEELPWKKVTKIAEQSGFPLPKTYNKSVDELVELSEELTFEDEGWVIRFASGLRVKIKVKDYLRMMKIVSHLSPLSIWEAMCENRIKQYLMEVPEELRDEVIEYRDRLEKQLNKLSSKIKDEAVRLNIDPEKKNFKEMAVRIKKEADPNVINPLFMVMRGRDIREWCLKQIRPKSNNFVELEQ